MDVFQTGAVGGLIWIYTSKNEIIIFIAAIIAAPVEWLGLRGNWGEHMYIHTCWLWTSFWHGWTFMPCSRRRRRRRRDVGRDETIVLVLDGLHLFVLSSSSSAREEGRKGDSHIMQEDIMCQDNHHDWQCHFHSASFTTNCSTWHDGEKSQALSCPNIPIIVVAICAFPANCLLLLPQCKCSAWLMGVALKCVKNDMLSKSIKSESLKFPVSSAGQVSVTGRLSSPTTSGSDQWSLISRIPDYPGLFNNFLFAYFWRFICKVFNSLSIISSSQPDEVCVVVNK